MGKNFASWKRFSQIIGWMAAVVVMIPFTGTAWGAVMSSCTDCHGMPPKDAARKANPHFRSQSSAVIGNHQTHVKSPAAPVDCNICHSPVSATAFGHQTDVINMANSIKGYSSVAVRAKYNKGTFFNQTSIPVLSSCSSISCHFERVTPVWGTSSATTSCATCHDATQATLSHPKHTVITACASCHSDHSIEAAPYAHATSAGRAIAVTVGTYAGSNSKYLPSQTGRVLGSCTTAYCHSTVQGTTGAGAGAYQPVTWGGAAQTCGSCHKNMATDATGSGSHQLHASGTTTGNGTGVNFTCQVCHGTSYSRSKTPAGGTHVNNSINLGFTTISGANAAGTVYSKGIAYAPGAVYGQCSASACHGAGKPSWGANSPLPECFKCHGSTSGSYTNTSSATIAPGGGTAGRDTGGNTAATSPRVGAHQTHLTGADNISSPIHCGECHTTHLTVKDSTHLNYTTATISFGPLAKTASHAPGVARAAGVITCSNTYCHTGNRTGATASSTTPVFTSATLIGGTSVADTCTGKCHGMPPGGAVVGDTHAALGASGTYTTPASLSACSSQTGGTGCHPTINAAPASMAAIFFDKTKHINGTVDAAGGHAFPYGGSVHKPGGTGSPLANAAAPYTNCNGCHDTTTTGGAYPVTAGVKPLCSACHLNTSNFTGATPGCYDCHGSTATNGQPNGNAFPNISGNHSKHITIAALVCASCHNGFGTGSVNHGFSNRAVTTKGNVAFSGLAVTPTWTAATNNCTASCHIAAVWGTHLGCIDCHASTITRTKGRPGTTLAAVNAEFGLAWGHKKSGRGAVTDADCIVCHLEGDSTTHKTSAKHADGNIDLRDPLGATPEAAITNMSGAAWTFQRFSTSYAPGSRTSTGNAANTIDNIVTQKFCLGCHSSTGATNTGARSGTAPTQYLPFGTGANTGYALGISAGVVGGVFDAKSQFATTNASYHPVIGPLNKGWPTPVRLLSPYNNFTRTGGTKSNGVVINCFDCHNVANPAVPLTLRTVVAHGNAVTLRGPVRVSGSTAATQLCLNCHTTDYATTSTGNHGANTAFSSGADTAMNSRFTSCYYCHGTATAGATVTGTTQVRPIRAVEVHGFNDRTQGTVGSKWPSGARPYAFIRNSLSNWAPASGTGDTITGAHTCSGTGGTCDNNMGNSNYTPGGAY